MGRRIWASKDRYTAWDRYYELTYKDGTVETNHVSETRLLYPRKHQFMVREFLIKVVGRDRQLFSRATGRKIKPRSRYWTASQTFHGGPSANGDALGGFTTGGHMDILTRAELNKFVRELERRGFSLVSTR